MDSVYNQLIALLREAGIIVDDQLSIEKLRILLDQLKAAFIKK